MSHPIAAFADQVRPGMRVSQPWPSDLWAEPVTITQVRAIQTSILGESSSTVHMLGEYDDGRPFAYVAGPQMAVFIHDTVRTPA